MKVARFAQLFDHSCIKPETTRETVLQAAHTAIELQTATLTVQPHYIEPVKPILAGSGVLLGTVIGFPHGNETPAMKEAMAKIAIDLGAEEIDMVMNIPALKNGEREVFQQDVAGVVQAAGGSKVKVITENYYLSDEEKTRACQWIADAGAHFVKTSTAYAAGAATVEDVRLMQQAVAGRCLVKAAGGIRQIEEVLDYLRAGAIRFGSTRTGQFVESFHELPPEQKKAYAEFIDDIES